MSIVYVHLLGDLPNCHLLKPKLHLHGFVVQLVVQQIYNKSV